jgi:subtilisin family serine protease
LTTQETGREQIGEMRAKSCIRRFPTTVLASDKVVPVVIEFQQPPVAVYKKQNPTATEEEVQQYQEHLLQLHQEFLDRLTSLGVGVQVGTSAVMVAGPQGPKRAEVRHDFTYVFNGLGLLMPGRMVARAAELDVVRMITHNTERTYLNLDRSVPFTGAPQLWEQPDAAGLPISGEGVTVAVIDTGIDWTDCTERCER